MNKELAEMDNIISLKSPDMNNKNTQHSSLENLNSRNRSQQTLNLSIQAHTPLPQNNTKNY